MKNEARILTKGRVPRFGWLVVVLAVAAVLPLVMKGIAAQHILFTVLFIGYLGLAWNILGGMTGQYSFGHHAYVGIGGYTSTLLFNHLGLSPWLGMLAGALFAGIAALILGTVVLRLRGYYFVLGTLAVAGALYGIVVSIEHIGGFVVGASSGVLVKGLGNAPLYFQSLGKVFYLYVAMGMVLLAVVVTEAIGRSKLGYYMRAIREDEDAAQAIGINSPRVKVIAFVISASLTALGGTLLAQYALFAGPDRLFGWQITVMVIMAAVIGGVARTIGPVLGAVVVVTPSEILRFQLGALWGTFPVLIYGLVLVVVILAVPRGLAELLAGAYDSVRTRVERKWRYSKSET